MRFSTDLPPSYTSFNQPSIDGPAVFYRSGDVPFVPAPQNVQFQFPYTSFADTTFSNQYAHDTVQGMAQDTYSPSQHAMPRTTIASLESSIRAAQWRENSEMGVLDVGRMWPPTVVPVLPQSIPPQPLITALTPLWLEVPQRPYRHGEKQSNYRPCDPISFSINNRPGINLEKALRKQFTHLDGRDDPIFRNISTKAVSCRFLFPGYVDGSAQIPTLDWRKNRAPITRSKLAYEVAKKLNRYLEYIAGQVMDESADQQWKVGGEYMHLRNMYLVRLLSVSTGSYQPEIWIRTR